MLKITYMFQFFSIQLGDIHPRIDMRVKVVETDTLELVPESEHRDASLDILSLLLWIDLGFDVCSVAPELSTVKRRRRDLRVYPTTHSSSSRPRGFGRWVPGGHETRVLRGYYGSSLLMKKV